jgi:hypothetical protein
MIRGYFMVSKKYFIIALFLFLGINALWAQTTGYYVELRFIQRLTWSADEYAMRYEVIIQREERNAYHETLREFTEASFIEVSLHPGKYRCQVIPYDYLGKPVPANEWVNFEVLPGIAAELNNQLIPGDYDIIIVNPSGTAVNRAEVTLPKPETGRGVEYVIEPEKTVEKTDVEYRYEVEKTIEYMRQFDLYAGAAYVPLLPVYGKNNFIGRNISLAGISARLCAVSAKQGFLNPGVELAASWSVYGNGGEEAVHSAVFDLNVLAQNRFPGGKTAINLRAGAGLSLLPQNHSAPPNGQYSIHVNIGASFLWLLRSNFYMETGVDYSHSFSNDSFGLFRPWIGLGYRF